MAWGQGSIVALLFLLPIAGGIGRGASLPSSAADSAKNVALADVAYRKADFDQAASYYHLALSLDPRCARAFLGLGRIEELNFRRGAARDYYSAAYRLDPRDPKIIRAYASVVTNREAQTTLLRNYLVVGGDDREGLESALGQIQLNRQLGDRETGILESPYRAYSLRMTPYFPTVRPTGMLLAVTINDAKPLRLIFDTGAEGIMIRAKAAEKLGLEFVGSKQVRGLGAGEPSKSRIGLARSLRIGDLRIKNCLIDVGEAMPSGDADGVIGPALLQRFLIRFSAAEKRLELQPFPELADTASERPWNVFNRTIPAGMEKFVKALQVGHLLMVKARANGESQGQYVLDTGAAFSLVSCHPASPCEIGSESPAYGLSGRFDVVRVSPIRFQFAREPLVDSDPVAFDLRGVSSQTGVEVSGLIGYPALSRKALTINYRDGLIDAGP